MILKSGQLGPYSRCKVINLTAGVGGVGKGSRHSNVTALERSRTQVTDDDPVKGKKKKKKLWSGRLDYFQMAG